MSSSRFPVSSFFAAHTRDFFRLLDELSTVPTAAINTQRRAFSPKFDVHEKADVYILESELRGIEDKSKINIEFTYPQILVVRGKIEKYYSHSSENNTEQKQVDAGVKNETKEVNTTGTIETAVQKEEGSGEGSKYWVAERTRGLYLRSFSFQRSFSFPGTIDIDAVKATLEHGILKIVVPKKKE
ncbi:hypothetical protein RUND412_009745 [Rhizina undulata]